MQQKTNNKNKMALIKTENIQTANPTVGKPKPTVNCKKCS